MNFSLPVDFADHANEIERLFSEYEATRGRNRRDELLRLALIKSCGFLSSINLDDLRRKMIDIRWDLRVYERDVIKKSWSEGMFDEPHFAHFLEVVEDGIFNKAGLEPKNRQRLKDRLVGLRLEAQKQADRITPNEIVDGIRELQDDICQLKNQVISEPPPPDIPSIVFKTTCVVAIVANAVGEHVLIQSGNQAFIVSPAAAEASITLGAVG